MTKIISLFNHKGGVSKTTTTFHLAWKMADMGKRVLIVDADPQCNLTGLTLGLENQEDLFAFYDSKQNNDIFNSLAPIFNIDTPTQITRSEKILISKTNNRNLFILAGSIRFSELDNQVATAITMKEGLPILKAFVGAFNKIIRDAARQNEIDIVIIDMSPSVSATNQCILMSSDYFIIPISPDFYCYQSVDSLSKVLPDWNRSIAYFRNSSYEYSMPMNPPQMLGFVSQNYRVYTIETQEGSDEEKQQKTMAKEYKKWIDKIKICANDKLFPLLQNEKMLIDSEIFQKFVRYDTPYHIAGIQNFNTLIPVSQRLTKPMYKLTEKDGSWQGARWSATSKNGKKYGVEENIKEADKVYSDLANSVLGMIGG
jgi:chromosome partitioning protein